jgi:vacuolar-type H+-ATPase subunit I/STV1
MLRSQEMQLFRVLTPAETAYELYSCLGDIEAVHLIDAEEGEGDEKIPLFNRPFHKMVRRCDDTIMLIESLEAEAAKFEIEVRRCENVPAWLIRTNEILVARRRIPQTYF